MGIRAKLETLASNYWWSFTPRAQAVFERIDPALWESSDRSPLVLLHSADDEKLRRAFADKAALDELDAVLELQADYLGDADTWVTQNTPDLRHGLVAYFCAEFGIHESLPLYSGGLGVLAGDHVKTAGDLGVPFVAIGLKYPEGYFRQSIDAAGQQREEYPPTDWATVPATLVMRGDKPLLVEIPISDRTVYARIWLVNVGRSRLYLLDTNVSQNNAEDRGIGGRLYSGGNETRIRQEIVLGIGGVRLLRALGLQPTVYHLNEGHCSFACLELMRERIALGDSFERSISWVKKRTLFTTHTPVPAGHDKFAPDLMGMMLWRMQQQFGVDWRTFLSLGRVNGGDDHEQFCMTVLAMKCAARTNAVSELHAEVTRDMWHGLFPGWRREDLPIGAVTNGIHVETFLHPVARKLYDDRFGEKWQAALLDNAAWASLIGQLSDDEIVNLKRTLKLDMFRALRDRIVARAGRVGPDSDWIMGALGNWRADVLTIGFARRFATYKRGAMLFGDLDRALRLIADADRPIQLLFSGKAHPQDGPGKEIIHAVLEAARNPKLKGRILFIENYDMGVARSLISGVDVWLNTPRRPREASGTSGEKVVAHAGVNCSILDGWWAEGYNGENGYAIGDLDVPSDADEQDRRDTAFLFDVLEKKLLPDYYGNAPGKNPKWVSLMRGSLTTLPAQFSTRRMMRDYIQKYYAMLHRESRNSP